MNKVEKISKSTTIKNTNCTEEQNKQKVQNLETSQNEKQTSKERAKKYNEKRQKKKEEERNRNSKRHEKRKKEKNTDENTDEEFNRSQKKRKTQKLENDNSSINIENRYNTRSKTRRQNTNCEPMQLNSSQSNKQKQITDDNIIKRRRTTKNKNTNKNKSSNQHSENEDIDESNNITTQEQMDNTNGHIEKESINMDECLKLFNIIISNGPIYVCTVCLQTWFRRSVFNIEIINITSEAEEQKLNQCRKNYVSAEDKEWICKGCRDSIKTGRIPRFSIENKMGFPRQPQELKLNGMEERFTAPRLTLFQMRDLPCGGQKSVRGNSVNLPIDIAPTVEMLPHTLDNTETIAINYKRHLCYKGCAFKQENIRPAAVWKAVNYLMTHSQMYNVPRELTFAPGEGQYPISVFHDPDAEYLSFPTIFCGQRRVSDEEHNTSVHYTEICRYEFEICRPTCSYKCSRCLFQTEKGTNETCIGQSKSCNEKSQRKRYTCQKCSR